MQWSEMALNHSEGEPRMNCNKGMSIVKRKPFEQGGSILVMGILVVVLATLSLSAWATVPERLRLQGLLEDGNGDAVAGTADLIIQLYTTKEGTTAVFTETVSSVALEQGRFSLNVGDAPTLGTLSAVITANPELWLGLSINGGAELPRQRLESVPFALQAKDLECAGCIQKTDIQDGVFSSVAFSGAYDELINAPDTSTLLSGVGTANALPKYTAAGTLGDSSVTEAGGLVGIGTAPPISWQLHVEGEGAATGHVAHFSNGGGVAYVGIGANQKSHYLYTKSNGSFGIHVPGVGDKLTILNNGNVGIGTTTPTSILSIDGTTFNGAAAANNLLHLQGTTSASLRFQTAGGGGTSADLRAANGEGLYFEVDDVPRMYINTSGNVGIGTDGPTAKLDIRGNENIVQLNVRANSEQGDFVVFENSVGGNLFEFTGAGNLEVMKGMLILKNGKPVALKDNLGANRHVLLMDDKNRVNLDNPTGGPVLLNSSGGDVGIGTTSPSAPLHVSSNTGVKFQSVTPGDSASDYDFTIFNLKRGVGATTNIHFDMRDSASATATYSKITSTIRDNTNGSEAGTMELSTLQSGTLTEVMRLGSSGDVGIGANGGTRGRLLVSDDTVSYNGINEGHGTLTLQITKVRTAGEGPHISFVVPKGAAGVVEDMAYIAAVASDSTVNSRKADLTFGTRNQSIGEKMRLTSDGKVGIGTTSPSEKLDVAGTVKATKFVGDGSSLTGISAGKWSDATGGIDYSGGNVGIGTTSPTEKLHVKGAIRSGNRLDIYEGTDTTRVGLLGAWNDLGGGILPNNNDFVIKSGSGLGISFAPNNGGSAAYISSSGNVGIGTNAPISKLDVHGSARIVGDNGLTNVWMGALESEPNIGQLTVNNADGDPRAGLFTSATGGGILVGRGLNGKMNSALWYYGSSPDHGLLELFDDTETARVSLNVHSNNSGQLRIYGPSGQMNVGLWNLSGSNNNGALHLYDDSAIARVSLTTGDSDQNAGKLILTGKNGETNAYLAHYNTDPNHGILHLNDDTGKAKVSLNVHNSNTGQLFLYGPSGQMNVGLWSLPGSNNNGALHLYDDSATSRVSLTTGDSDQNAGRLALTGKNGNQNTYLGYYDANPDHGLLVLSDATGTGRARLSVDTSNNYGKLQLYGPNEKLNVWSGAYGGTDDHGVLLLYDNEEDVSVRLDAKDNDTGGLTLYGATAAKTNIWMNAYSSALDVGQMVLYGANSQSNVWLGAYTSAPDEGAMQIYNSSGDARIRMDLYQGSGRIITYGNNGNKNIEMGTWGGTANQNLGKIVVYNSSGSYKAGIYVSNSTGNGIVFGDYKSFRMDHPEKPDHEIWYASVEGPEVAAYVRGTAQLVDGKARVMLPDHFRVLAANEGITVTLTPLSAASKGLAVVTTSPESFSVTELHAGRGSYGFYWEVKAVRIGYEDYTPVRHKDDLWE